MKTLNEEINKMKHLFNYKKGDLFTETLINEQVEGEPVGGGVKTMDIYWQSCDGNMNKLSDESKNLLISVSGEDKPTYTFKSIPQDKHGEYEIADCLGVYSTNDKFEVADYDGKKVLRVIE